MSDTMTGTRFDMTTPHLRVAPDEMPSAWRRVAADLRARGFGIAAANMRDIMRSITPRMYFLGIEVTNAKAGPVVA